MQKLNLFSINYSIADYEKACDIIIKNAILRASFGVSALAVHGLMMSFNDRFLRNAINKIHLVVPDGMPIRWALNSFYQCGLKDRVYGPTLTLHVLKRANERKLNVYLYGSTEKTIQSFCVFIKKNFPDINICGIHVDRFRDATLAEDIEDIKKINNSKTNLVLVGRGCPRQEIWVSEHIGKINAVMMAVGAAFDFHAGTVKQAPRWMQNHGLEWLFRFAQEPKRLWKRYLFTNSQFIYLYLKHKFILRRPYS